MTLEFRHRRYELIYRGSPIHRWQTHSVFGAAFLEIRENDVGGAHTDGVVLYCRRPPSHMASNPPTVTNCPVIGGACWAAPLSLLGDQLPWWRHQVEQGNHATIFEDLEQKGGPGFIELFGATTS